ncbi:hypothetical protein BDV32DRAFT_154729 [Aspergillus pseudonomiae]|uniref:AMP-dependent synthetase/ligase domain-containing protein n=1 Tax=Aspergillus pseudonomiae TaxID=1506151 RepID=A0A5N7DSV1_9EURO|nr:uncharacterized protein BDV37DRAFT_278327 [Aspergillus pseudonomiae]KAB8254989.1 hypothetical protein BDV32DRAFT_154729 [Aspergillus pseudonomiae]KAE8409375.1 hypothetical protein BDV37DRAFT_278327 [Aspergillus pseudonomiae]
MDYAELHCHTVFLSHRLIKAGVTTDELIGIVTEAGFEHIVAQAAIIYAGCTISNADPMLPETQVRHHLPGAQIVLADKKHLGCLDGYKMMPIHTNSLTEEELQIGLQCPPPRTTRKDHRTHLMHTAGSTGKPKAVPIQAKGLIHLVSDDRAVPITPQDRVAQLSMVSFDMSMFEIWVTLPSGATILPLPWSLLKDIFELAR